MPPLMCETEPSEIYMYNVHVVTLRAHVQQGVKRSGRSHIRMCICVYPTRQNNLSEE